MLVSQTPLRVSLAGGGTDLPAYYGQSAGAVVSMTIARYVSVTVRRPDRPAEAAIRVTGSCAQIANSVDELGDRIVRECLRHADVEPPIQLSVSGDRPQLAGLGGSSALTVSLLHAVGALRGESPRATELAEAAAYVEINMLGEPIGKQDHYSAAVGGLNFLLFSSDEVLVQPLGSQPGRAHELVDHLLLLWTGIERRAASILREQRENVPARRTALDCMRDHAYELAELLAADQFEAAELGRIVSDSWQLKRTLGRSVSNATLDEWLGRGLEAGALGAKVCGAGGGGCLLFVVAPEQRAAVRRALGGLAEVGVQYEPRGSVISQRQSTLPRLTLSA
jgi:D-glycero-alpha-D-manno-heptose-7-phosphate kinase